MYHRSVLLRVAWLVCSSSDCAHSLIQIDPIVHCRLISCESDGEKLRACVHAVTLDLYDLISSTVSGIPMKVGSFATRLLLIERLFLEAFPFFLVMVCFVRRKVFRDNLSTTMSNFSIRELHTDIWRNLDC